MISNKLYILKNFLYHIKEFYYSGKITINKKKNNFLIEKHFEIKTKYSENELENYLKKNNSISETKLINPNKKIFSKNCILMFESKIFSNFDVKIYNNLFTNKKILIYLPGFHTSAIDVCSNINHPEYLLEMCIEKKVTLITWDWPLSGNRLNNGLFQNSYSIYTAEKEYSKILGYYGSSLFVEYIDEYKEVLKEVVRIYKDKKIYVVGYSMGGFFSYFSSIINNNIFKTFQTRVNGHYYYPHNVIEKFDLDSVIKTSAKRVKNNLVVIFGDKDINCSNTVRKKIELDKTKNIYFKVIKNHSHNFSDKIIKILKNEF